MICPVCKSAFIPLEIDEEPGTTDEDPVLCPDCTVEYERWQREQIKH